MAHSSAGCTGNVRAASASGEDFSLLPLVIEREGEPVWEDHMAREDTRRRGSRYQALFNKQFSWEVRVTTHSLPWEWHQAIHKGSAQRSAPPFRSYLQYQGSNFHMRFQGQKYPNSMWHIALNFTLY